MEVQEGLKCCKERGHRLGLYDLLSFALRWVAKVAYKVTTLMFLCLVF